VTSYKVFLNPPGIDVAYCNNHIIATVTHKNTGQPKNLNCFQLYTEYHSNVINKTSFLLSNIVGSKLLSNKSQISRMRRILDHPMLVAFCSLVAVIAIFIPFIISPEVIVGTGIHNF